MKSEDNFTQRGRSEKGRWYSMERFFVILVHGMGDPLPQIDDDDMEWLQRSLRELGGSPDERRLDLILHSPGGDIDAAYQIGDLLRSSCSELWVVVPYKAMSAATMLAFAADHLVVGVGSYFSPLSPVGAYRGRRAEAAGPAGVMDGLLSECGVRAGELAREFARALNIDIAEALSLSLDFVAKCSTPIFSKLDPLEIDQAKSALSRSQAYIANLLERGPLKGNASQARELAAGLVTAHDWVFTSGDMMAYLGPHAVHSDSYSEWKVACDICSQWRVAEGHKHKLVPEAELPTLLSEGGEV
jgi:hypothetical protein